MLFHYSIVHMTRSISYTLLYFLNLFLNISARILLNFFNLHIACSNTILFLKCILLYSFSFSYSGLLRFFSSFFYVRMIVVLENRFLRRYPRSNTLTTCFGVKGYLMLF